MNVTTRLARHDALTDALREADRIIGSRHASAMALQIIDAIKRLRDEKPARVALLEPVDYLTRVQEAAQTAADPATRVGAAKIETPIGILTATTWRTTWRGKRGEREVWRSEYGLDGAPITIAEIKAAGLAQRPTKRRRRVK